MVRGIFTGLRLGLVRQDLAGLSGVRWLGKAQQGSAVGQVLGLECLARLRRWLGGGARQWAQHGSARFRAEVRAGLARVRSAESGLGSRDWRAAEVQLVRGDVAVKARLWCTVQGCGDWAVLGCGVRRGGGWWSGGDWAILGFGLGFQKCPDSTPFIARGQKRAVAQDARPRTHGTGLNRALVRAFLRSRSCGMDVEPLSARARMPAHTGCALTRPGY